MRGVMDHSGDGAADTDGTLPENADRKEQFELLYGYIHCRGKTTYSAGYVDTEEEAEAWIRNHREGTVPKMKIPPDDPIRYCRAAWCPFKKQKPWFDMVHHPVEPF